jgi:hypothetical protein
MPEWLIKFDGGYKIVPAPNDRIAEEIFTTENPGVEILSSSLETMTEKIWRKMRERRLRLAESGLDNFKV